MFEGQPRSIMAVNQRLYAESVWLFLDGVEAFIEDDKFKAFLSRLSPADKGKVVITSRIATNLRNELRIDLLPLRLDDAITLFVDSWQPLSTEFSDSQRADMKTICGESLLAGHPGSIERIGSDVKATKRSDLSSIVTRLKKNIQGIGEGSEKAISSVNVSLESRTEQARNLLARLSLLPGEFDESDVSAFGKIAPGLDWESAFDELLVTNLVQVTGSHIDDTSIYEIPAVVRSVARRKAKELPEYLKLQKCAGEILVKSSRNSTWVLGLISLLEAKQWREIALAFRERFSTSFLGEHLFTESDSASMNEALAYYAISYTYDQLGNAGHAQEHARRGKEILENAVDVESIRYKALYLRLNAVYARNLLVLGDEMGQSVIEATTGFVETLNDEQRNALKWELGQIYLLEGIYYHYLVGNDSQAEEVSRRAVDIYSSIKDVGQYLRALSNLGTAFEGQGRLCESVNLSQKILDLLKQQQSYSTLSTKAVESLFASETANLVDALTKLGEFEKAEQYAYEGLKYCENHALRQSQAALLINTGMLEIELGKYEQALKTLSEALQLSRDLTNKSYEDQTHSYLALPYHHLGDFAKAQHNMEIALHSEDSYCLAEAHRIAGEIYLAQGDVDSAEQELLESKH
jgi:tetratricopeptide (TPR) repeat protein